MLSLFKLILDCKDSLKKWNREKGKGKSFEGMKEKKKEKRKKKQETRNKKQETRNKKQEVRS